MTDQPPQHHCRDPWLRLRRLMLAGLNHNDPADLAVDLEIGGCASCWRAVALTAVSELANDRAIRVGGKDKAINITANEINHYLKAGQ